MWFLLTLLTVAPTVNKQVWTYWDTGEHNLPAFNQYNLRHWRNILEPKGYQISVVDSQNIRRILGGQEYLPEFWDELGHRVSSYSSPTGSPVKMVPSVVKSDFARLALLEKLGGIWMDTSNVLLEDLDTIIVNALDQDVSREVGGYVMRGYASSKSPIVDGEPVDGLENWFIAAKAHSQLIREWRLAFTSYWQTRRRDEHISRHAMYSVPGFDFGGLSISSAEYLNQHAALKYVLFHSPELAQKIMPVKHLQPWWFHGRVGGNSADLYTGFVSAQISDYKRNMVREGVQMLKFAGPHLTEIRKQFRTLDDFCRRPNLLAELYGDCS